MDTCILTDNAPNAWKRKKPAFNAGMKKKKLVAPQHALDQVAQWSPEILPVGQPMLVDKEHIVLEAGVQVRLEAQVHDNRVVVAVDVRVHPV